MKFKIVYVLIIVVKMIFFVVCLGFFVKIWIFVVVIFFWVIFENKFVKVIGREVFKKFKFCIIDILFFKLIKIKKVIMNLYNFCVFGSNCRIRVCLNFLGWFVVNVVVVLFVILIFLVELIFEKIVVVVIVNIVNIILLFWLIK